MDERDLQQRRAIFESFAATGAPASTVTPVRWPSSTSSCSTTPARSSWPTRSPPTTTARASTPQGRTWWGNCAWDAFGIVAALKLQGAKITAQGIELDADDPADALFRVLVPARHWWDDIGFT